SVPQGFNSIRSAVSAFNQYAASQVQQILMSRDAVRLELNLGDYEQFQTIINALMNDMVNNGESVSESAVTIGTVSKNTINSDTGFLYADKQLDGVTPPIRGGAAYDHYVGTESQLAVASDDLTIRCTLDADAI